MLHIHAFAEIPVETRMVAEAAFPKGNVVMAIRDRLGTVYTDEQFQDLFPGRGQPAESPARLALVTVLQFMEGLTDRQTADAVRGRIDWKYALGLELTDAGFHYSVLSEFRSRLLMGGAEERLLSILVTAFQGQGLLKPGGRARTDSTHVVAAIRQLNRLELVGESMRQALNQLAHIAPEWLKRVALTEWYERYGRRFDSFHLPDSHEKRQALANQIGKDGNLLLTQAYTDEAPLAVRSAHSIEVLRRVWLQQYKMDTTGSEVHVLLRARDELPPAAKRLLSPYDLEARYARHNDKEWVGFRTHITESCDENAPIHLITHVETVAAPTQDVEVCESIHTNLTEQGLKPAEHFVDAAYLSATLLSKAAKEDGITIIGPVTKLQDVSWQAREQTGHDASQFKIDWAGKKVTCPDGQTSAKWVENCQDRTQNPVIHVAFAASTCQPCTARALCTRSQAEGRNMQLRPQAQHQALQQARAYGMTEAFKQKYRTRLGIEGSISQAVRAFELRETRYRGLLKTHLQAVAMAAAIDLCRFWDYLCGTGLGQTRISPFANLAGAT